MKSVNLIDILKNIVNNYSTPDGDAQNLVKKYFDSKFSSLKKIKTENNLIYFFNTNGFPEFIYSPKSKILRVKNSEFKEIQSMFNVDELECEEIFKIWLKNNFDVDIVHINYYD